MKALLLSHGSFQYDAILDSGANANILPTSYLSSVNNLVRTSGTLTIGDNSSIPTFAIASYGILDRVILSHTIACALISVSYLTSKLNLYVFYSYERAFIMQSVLPKVTDNSVALSATYRIVATATLLNDKLYHIDDMRSFLRPLPIADTIDTTTQPKALFSISKHPYTEKEIKYGGAKVFIKSNRQYLSLLQWLHVRLGHANESLLHWIVDKKIVLGSGLNSADQQTRISFLRYSGTLAIGDNSSIPTFAIASYGILNRVILSHTIACALISVSYLTSKLNLYVFYSYERAFIMQSVLPKVTDNSVALSATYRIVATATLLNDKLYHIDDMRSFLRPLPIADTIDTTTQPKALFSISKHPYTEKEIKYGGAKVFIKSNRQYLSLLQWLHVRLGHANESLLHWIVDKKIVLGSGLNSADLAKLELGPYEGSYARVCHASITYSQNLRGV